MRIKNRLHISTLFSIVTVFVAGAVALLTFDQINKVSEEGITADAITRGIFELNILTNDYLLYHEKRAQTQWQSKHDSLSKLLSTLEFKKPVKQSILRNINENHEDMESLFSQLLSSYERQNFNRNGIIHKQLEERLISQLLMKSQEMISGAFRLEGKSRKEMIAMHRRTDLIIMAMFLTLLAIIAVNSFLIGRSIVRPINKLQGDTEVIATGNLDYKVGTEAKDEIGQLSRAFDRMTRNLKAVTASRDELDKEVAKRKKVEEELRKHRDHLEDLVKGRTAEIVTINKELQAEIIERKQGEERLHQQFIRMNLLNQITSAAAEHQNVESIFGVVLYQLEEQLPIDFGCVCIFDPVTDTLTVSSIGSKSLSFANQLGIEQTTVIPIDKNGLRRCVKGQTVYEPDITQVNTPFLKKLSQSELRSLVGAPMADEKGILGILLAARRSKEAFTSVDCEFLRQLSEHVALAVQNAHLYEDLQKAYDELRETQKVVMEQERLRAMGQMASGLAHDINNALGPITLYTESLLEGEGNLSERAVRYLETIQTATNDIANTIARMREFYRKREEQIELLPVNLKEVIDQVIELTRPRWQNIPHEKGIVIDIIKDVPKKLPPLLGIETDIRDAATNLIFNAVDAMPEGGTLILKAGEENSELIFEVVDTGVGMDEETRLYCLEPFFTKKGERGTGLGLAMVYGVMQRHEGEIEIESEPGKGTTIRLVFPLREIPKTISVVYKRAITKPSPLRILFIDDDELMRESLMDTLESDGHQVQVAKEGQAGMDAFHAAKERGEIFNVVITDLGMPYMDGREVARMVKRESPGTPVILLTGWGTRINEEGETPAHVDRVLNKPPKINELRRAIIEVVENILEEGTIDDENP